jgi:hypothetical protein
MARQALLRLFQVGNNRAAIDPLSATFPCLGARSACRR